MPSLRSVLGGNTATDLGQGAALIRGVRESWILIPMDGIEDHAAFQAALEAEGVEMDDYEPPVYLEAHLAYLAFDKEE